MDRKRKVISIKIRASRRRKRKQLVLTSGEKLFSRFLDKLFWSGYGIDFLEDNPDAFYNQLFKFLQKQKRR